MRDLLKNSGLSWVWLALLALLLDQASKLWIASQFRLHETLELIPSFNLKYAHNPGAAFSFLGDASGWQRWFFAFIALSISLMLVWWLTKTSKQQRLLSIAYNLILGGAVGNLVDRVSYGYVIDFLDVYYGNYHWPTFNIADAAICLGAGLILLDAFLGDKQAK